MKGIKKMGRQKKGRLPESPQKRVKHLGAARRSLVYILRTILIFAVLLALCYAVFMEAMYVSNIYIIVTEGMEMRADCILSSGSLTELSEHFSQLWLNADSDLYSGKYDAYHVDTYDYRISLEKMSVLPWSKKAEVTIVERVLQIHATPYDDSNEAPVPGWSDARYKITLEKYDGKWIITDIAVVDRNPQGEPAHTPDYSQLQSLTPTVTHTPEQSPEQSPAPTPEE